MKKANLFQTQRIYISLLAIAGLIILLFGTPKMNDPSMLIGITIPMIISPFYQSYRLRKFYLKYDNNKICWNFPIHEKEQSIDLTDSKYEVTQDWKGLVFKGDNQSFEISLDQLKERDKKNVLKELQAFYA